MKHIKEHFKNLISLHFTKDSEIHLHEHVENFCLDISWKLINNPNHQNKKSKKLRIIISKERVEDYSYLDQEDKQLFDKKLSNYIKTKAISFDPNHDRPSSQAPPIETWHLIM